MRTEKSILNICVALVGQILSIAISFITRYIFIKLLPPEYLGINALFTNLLIILSLAELGIGSAITYSLYKPIALCDIEKIKSLMRLYKRAYQTIGILILVLGLCLMPFIDKFMKGNPSVSNLHLIYIIFVINTVVPYFFSYKKGLIIADQKSYITTLYRYTYFIAYNIVQIVVLVSFQDYILFLCVQVILNLIENYIVSRRADKLYPYLRDITCQQLEVGERHKIFSDIRSLFLHKVGLRFVLSIDNVLISTYMGILWAGLYSNYTLITNALHTITEQILFSMTASVGNLNAKESKEKNLEIYRIIFFANYCMFSLLCIYLLVLLNPFLTLWIGKDYVLGEEIVLLMVVNFYITGLRKVTLLFKDAYGLFKPDRYRPLVEAGINLAISTILVKEIGIKGVLVGVLTSTLATSFWVEPYVLFRHGFNKSLRAYFAPYCYYTCVFMVNAITIYVINRFCLATTWLSFAGQFVLTTVLSIGSLLIWYFRATEFKYLFNVLSSIKSRLIKRDH